MNGKSNVIAKYYMTNDLAKLKHWTYENGIQGVKLNYNKEPQFNRQLNFHKKRER